MFNVIEHEVDLLDYLPPYLREYRELYQIMRTEHPEFRMVWAKAAQTRDNLFILTADEAGVRRYEQMLNITPEQDDTLETRRTRVILLMLDQIPYTMLALKRMLSAIVGEDGFSIDFRPHDYYLKVLLAPTAREFFHVVWQMLRRTIPANMAWELFLTLDPITTDYDLHAGVSSHTVYRCTMNARTPEPSFDLTVYTGVGTHDIAKTRMEVKN